MKFLSFIRNLHLGALNIHFVDHQFVTEDEKLIKDLLASPACGVEFDREKESGAAPGILGPGFLSKNIIAPINMQQVRKNKDLQIMHEKAAIIPAQTPQEQYENPEQRIQREIQAAQEKRAADPSKDTFEYGINKRPWRDPAKAEMRAIELFKRDGIRREVVDNPKGTGYCIKKIRE